MHNKLISIVIGVVLIVSMGTLVYFNKKSAYQPSSNNTNVVDGADLKITAFTLEQISAHKDASSCWTAINGGVYDLTSWIPNHPGGEQTILSLCGIDGSAGYNGQHGNSKKPAKVLGGFKVGVLTN